MHETTIVGIDLGTTNSEIAVYTDGRVEVFADEEGRRMLPSYVGLDEGGEILVGHPARNQYVVYPERTVRSVKRRMGEDVRLDLAGRAFSPQELSAVILRRLAAMAETALGRPVRKAVITVPAYFSDVQRRATREAGEIAGLEVVRMINEPTAAALVYESGRQGSRWVLVYDLGGGTFDVSVVRIENDVVEVAASHGDNHLGGDDFDAKITGWLLEALETEHGIPAADLPRQARARIERAAEQAKITLSDHPVARIAEEYLLDRDGVAVHLDVELLRHEYEEMITPFVDKTMAAVHRVLGDAGLAASQIDEILLVGGASRTPLVQERLRREFGKEPRAEVDPELCVASGAAMQAAMLAGRDVRAILVDVTPYTFGVAALSLVHGIPSPHAFVPIIRKNTPIPATKSELFATAHDDQETVEVEVYQGEDPDVRNNIKIGSFLVTGLRRAPAGNEILATFSLDASGVLEVTAEERSTGLAKSIRIEDAVGRQDERAIAASRQRVDELFGNEERTARPAGEAADGDRPGKKAARPARPAASGLDSLFAVQARAVIDKAHALFPDAESEDREEMEEQIAAIEAALAAGDEEAARTALDALSEIIFFLES